MAQSPNYQFQRLGVKDGLNQQNTFSVYQDKKGFIWCISQNGLQRYDGYHFLNFFAGTKNKLPSGVITSAAMDKKGRLWLITNHKALGYFDTDKFTYHPAKINLPVSFTDAGGALIIDKSDNIMIVYVGRGFVTYNEKTHEASVQNNLFSLPAGYEPRHWVHDDDLNYWIATANGFVKYSTKKKLLSYGGHNNENDVFINTFSSVKNCGVIYTDQSKRIWISYREPKVRMISFDPANKEIKSWDSIITKKLKGAYYEFWGLHDFKDDGIWIGGPGLFAKLNYDQNSIEPVIPDQPNEYSIRFDLIGSLFADRERSIWVCTDKGLYRFNPSAHIFYTMNNRISGEDKTYQNSVTDILETNDGEILVSTWGEGIFSYDKNFNPIVSKYVRRKKNYEEMVWCMLQTKNGDIWRGSQEGALYIYEAATKKTIFLTPDACNKRTIRQLAEDDKGNIWLGTQGGHLIKWNPATKQFLLQQQFRRLISRLYVDANNNIWVCTDLDGVYLVKGSDGSILNHYTSDSKTNKKILINGATDVIQYDDTTIVIASNGLNILNTKKNTFTYLDEGVTITNMIKDKKGLLWFSTSAGIVSRNLSKQNVLVSFDARDGINNMNFHVASAILLNNGNIVFGTNNDFITFNPGKALLFSFSLPEVQIASIALMNNNLSVDSISNLGKLNIKHDENSLSFDFTTNNFQNLFAIYYKLENIDKQWKQINGNLSLNYLPPGNYKLNVAAKDINGKNGKILVLEINVAAPFYRTWWFYSSILLSAIGLLLWFYNIRMRRKEAIHNIRTNIAGKLHEEVSITLNNINVLSEMAKLKAETDPQKSKEFIEQINDRSQSMIDSLDDMLWSITPENDSIEKTIERLQEFIDLQTNRYAVKIELTVDERIKQLNLPMPLRHEAFLLFKSSLNGLLQAGTENITIQVAKGKNYLLYLIKCDTVNCDTIQLSHLLQNRQLTQKMEALGVKWDVQVLKSHALMEYRIPLEHA